MTLHSRVTRLEILSGGRDADRRAVAVDRGPRLSRAQWLERQAAADAGRRYSGGPVNARGEACEQWAIRREREIGEV